MFGRQIPGFSPGLESGSWGGLAMGFLPAHEKGLALFSQTRLYYQ